MGEYQGRLLSGASGAAADGHSDAAITNGEGHTMVQIFISYAHEDEVRIQPLVHALENQGWSVFWDRHIPTGQTWRSYIGKALSDASCVMVAWSRDSIDSGWVSEEADEGRKRGILVPVLLDAVEPPMGFRSIQAADLSDWQPEHPSPRFEQLLHDIRETLQATPTPPPLQPSAAPKPHRSRQPFEPWHRTPKALSQRVTYGVLAATLVILITGGGYWIYPATPIDIGGTWVRDGTDVVYTITQTGSDFAWEVKKPYTENAIGTINGKVVHARWINNRQSEPLTTSGKIILGQDERAKKIVWNNSAIFIKHQSE